MFKRSLCVLLSCTMFIVTGCGLSSSSKNRLFGDKWVTWQMEQAIFNGNIEYVKELIAEHGDNQDLLNDMLLSACGDSLYNKHRAAMIELLVNAGADPNTSSSTGDSLLITYLFNYKDYFDVPYMLYKSDKIEIDDKDKTGRDALYYALNTSNESEFYSYTHVKMLLEAGAKPYKELFQDLSAASDDVYDALYNSPRSTRLLLETLLENGEESGLPKTLELAFLGRAEEAFNEIMRDSDDLNDEQKNITLMYLVYWGTPEQVKTVEKYWNIDFVDIIVLKYASQTNNADMMQYIVEKADIDLTEQDDYVYDAFENAAKMGNLNAIAYFCDNKCATRAALPRMFILSAAIMSENFDVFTVVYNYMSSTERLTEKEIDEALDHAIINRIYPEIFKENDRKIIDLLFEDGYNLSNISIDKYDYEGYAYITEKGRTVVDSDVTYALVNIPDINILKLALQNGADPNTIPSDDDYSHSKIPAIVSAVSCGTEYVAVLVDYGAEIPDDILAHVYNSSKKTVEYLIEHGAKTDITVDKIPDSPNGSFKTGKSFSLKDQWKAYGRDDLVELLK